MKHEERNHYRIPVIVGTRRVLIQVDQFGYLWNVWCTDGWIDCGGEGFTQAEAMNNFIERVLEFNAYGQ